MAAEHVAELAEQRAQQAERTRDEAVNASGRQQATIDALLSQLSSQSGEAERLRAELVEARSELGKLRDANERLRAGTTGE